MIADKLRASVLKAALKGFLTRSQGSKDGWLSPRSYGELTQTLRLSGKTAKQKDLQNAGEIPGVSQGKNLIDGYFNKTLGFKFFDATYPIVLFGDHTRNVKYLDFPFIVVADGVKLLTSNKICPRFLFYLTLHLAQTMPDRGYGRHFARLNQQIVEIPPMHEQLEICDLLDEILKRINQLAELEREREDLDRNFVTQIESAILQAALSGKLTAQKSEDGNAVDLLEKITQEKLTLSKLGKRKKQQPSLPVTVAEKHFDIPDTWEWVRLAQLGIIVGGGTPKSSESTFWGGNINWVTPADLGKISGKYIQKGSRNITAAGLTHSSATLIPQGSIIISSRAPIGYVAITMTPIATNQGCKSLVPTESSISEYLYYALLALASRLAEQGTGTTFKEVSASVVGAFTIPLPPAAEQERIVEKLNVLMPLIDQLAELEREKI